RALPPQDAGEVHGDEGPSAPAHRRVHRNDLALAAWTPAHLLRAHRATELVRASRKHEDRVDRLLGPRRHRLLRDRDYDDPRPRGRLPDALRDLEPAHPALQH